VRRLRNETVFQKHRLMFSDVRVIECRIHDLTRSRGEYTSNIIVLATVGMYFLCHWVFFSYGFIYLHYDTLQTNREREREKDKDKENR
jgi:hypothetical protein